MSIKRTFTVYTVCATVNGDIVSIAFSRQSKAEELQATLSKFGVVADIKPEKRTVEI